MHLLAYVSIAAIAFSGCATTVSDPARERTASASTSAAVSSTQNLRSGLPPQSLEAGECGLFLWSQTEITRLIFFARAGDNAASVFVENETVSLRLNVAGGDIFGQFLTDLIYDAQSLGGEVNVIYTPGEELEGGARISSGRISYVDSEGWTRVLPVLGVRACQPIVGSPLTPG
ncbi:MAG: hypothetical protein AAF583_04340 [Pseudomonadota bacterium]